MGGIQRRRERARSLFSFLPSPPLPAPGFAADSPPPCKPPLPVPPSLRCAASSRGRNETFTSPPAPGWGESGCVASHCLSLSSGCSFQQGKDTPPPPKKTPHCSFLQPISRVHWLRCALVPVSFSRGSRREGRGVLFSRYGVATRGRVCRTFCSLPPTTTTVKERGSGSLTSFRRAEATGLGSGTTRERRRPHIQSRVY